MENTKMIPADVDYNTIQTRPDINPMYATHTQTGEPLSKEESLFIYYLVAGYSRAEAFIKAGFNFPRHETGPRQREKGDTSRDATIQAIVEHNVNPLEYTEIDNTGKAAEGEDVDNRIKYSINITPNTNINDIPPELLYQITESARSLLRTPRLSSEYTSRILSLQDAQLADNHEVLAYFTAVMRGQVKDQFGLDASLQERTRAAEALAKRIIDIPAKYAAAQQLAESGAVQITIQPRHETIIDVTPE